MNHAVTPSVFLRAPASWPVVAVALLSWISITVCLDPAGSYPHMPEGPGLTVDEIFNVEQGVYLVEQARALGWLNLVPGTSQEAYRIENRYNPDHPPLGRWWLGMHHHVTWWLAPPFEPEGLFVTACARTGSATAFALTVLMIGWFATVWSGRAVGIMTAISLVLMPRVYGHAHLASLETITNLTCTAAVLGVANWWTGPAPPSKRAATFIGVLLGLALLTKIQAVLIPIPVICWALWNWRTRAVVPLALWGVTAFIVFFAGWPYLWFDPLANIGEFLGRATNRATIQVWYFGQKYADKLVPWHYPFVMFALTVPAVLHGLGLLGVFYNLKTRICASPKISDAQRPNDNPPAIEPSIVHATPRRCGASEGGRGRDLLLLACALFPLVVFALPGVAVYDGERLFLASFPLWAIFVGRGWVVLWRLLVRWTHFRWAAPAVWSALILFATSPLITMSPCHLCYFNEATLLFSGAADRANLEIDYWGEGITRGLLQRLVQSIPQGATVAVIPTLHQFQADEYRRQSPILRRHGVNMVEYQPSDSSQKFILVFRRRADLPNGIDDITPLFEPLETTTLGGRRLAFLARRAAR